MYKLILFDIDGTLLLTGGAGRSALEKAVSRVTGIPVDSSGFSFCARTDLAIVAELLALCGKKHPSDNDFSAVFREYLSILPGELEKATMGRALPGTISLLERISNDPGVCLGLLTGNIREGAFTKLAAYGLDSFFSEGAFGDDSPHRPDLLPIALERCSKHFGIRFQQSDTLIVGDAPGDVECGRANNTDVLCVATGWTKFDQLAALDPAYTLHDLTDGERFLNILAGTN